MKIELKSERHNPHMKRKEMMIQVEHEGEATPKREALRQLVSRQMNTNLDSTDVRNIFSEAGTPKSQAKVFVWTEKIPEQKKKKEKKGKEAKK